jgi:hypothetical protein
MIMPERQKTTLNYRFGFNSQEKVDEINSVGNHNTASFWEYDTRVARRWNLDPKGNSGISLYSAFENNPVTYSDEFGDTIRANWLPVRTFDHKSNWQDFKNLVKGRGLVLYKVADEFVKNKCNDGHFLVFSHGGPSSMEFSSKDGSQVIQITNAQKFDELMTASTPEWEKAKDDKNTVLTIYSCEAASNTYTNSKGVTSKVPINIAQKISLAHPNIIVEAPNGYVTDGYRDGKPTYLGVEGKNNDGAFIRYQNGKEIPNSRIPANYNPAQKTDPKTEPKAEQKTEPTK